MTQNTKITQDGKSLKIDFWRPDRDLNPGRSLDRAA